VIWLKNTFRSLKNPSYRIWAIGAFLSNIGTWMQRTAQGWMVLTELTHNNATAVGVVMALQFGPQILLVPVTGFVADHFDRQRLVFITQAMMAALALGLGLLTVTGLIQLWQVYIFALLLGCVTAFDTPARQTFVTELVDQTDLPNAVALNSTSFNAARMIGPAVAGGLIASVGSGWVFIINAASFAAVLCSLCFLRTAEIQAKRNAARTSQGFVEGLRYIAKRPDLRAILLMVFWIGTFGLNFPIFISAMAATVFHAGAHQFGLLTSMMAIGSVTGALLAAGRTNPGINLLLGSAVCFGFGCALAAIMPSYWFFGIALIGVGISVQTFTTTANSVLQLSTEPFMRGRIIALFMAIALGTTPIGAPIVGWIADRFGARWALGIGAASGFAAALVGIYYLTNYQATDGSTETPASGDRVYGCTPKKHLEQEETGATEV
jgi:MFS family permease